MKLYKLLFLFVFLISLSGYSQTSYSRYNTYDHLYKPFKAPVEGVNRCYRVSFTPIDEVFRNPPSFEEIKENGQKACIWSLALSNIISRHRDCKEEVKGKVDNLRVWVDRGNGGNVCFITSSYRLICSYKYCPVSVNDVKKAVKDIENGVYEANYGANYLSFWNWIGVWMVFLCVHGWFHGERGEPFYRNAAWLFYLSWKKSYRHWTLWITILLFIALYIIKYLDGYDLPV